MAKRSGSFDYETFSEADLKSVAADAYSRHPSTELLMVAWSYDDEDEVHQWDCTQSPRPPKEFIDFLKNPNLLKYAWNMSFEWHITKNLLGIEIPFNECRDTMVMSKVLNLPGKLEKAGHVVGIPEDKKKQATGKALIRRFCVPRKPTKHDKSTRVMPTDDPEKFEEFKEYNRLDVIAEKSIKGKLRKYDLPPHEWDMWMLDQKINKKGIPMDLAAAQRFKEHYEYVQHDRLSRMERITGVANANSPSQLLPWLNENGYRFEDLKKGHVQTASEEAPKGSQLKRVLDYRLEASKVSCKKFDAILRTADADASVVRDAFQFAGAGRTWRWAGRNFQAQNLPKPVKEYEKQADLAKLFDQMKSMDSGFMDQVFAEPTNLLSSLIRPVATAPAGMVFYSADLNAIENRGIGYIANDQKILDVFRNNRCPYLSFAQHIFNMSYEDLWHEYDVLGKKAKRTTAKPGVLGCFAPETLVLTDGGWTRIDQITVAMRLWDGAEWVSSEGCIYQGKKKVINLHGVQCTPEHLILVREGLWADVWMRADEVVDSEIHFGTALSNANAPAITLSKPALGEGHAYTYDILNCGPRNRYTVLTDAGPIIVHNCGYGLGKGSTYENDKTGEIEATGLLGYAWNMHIRDFTQEQSDISVTTFRETYTDVVNSWKWLEAAAHRAVMTRKPQQAGPLVFDMQGPFLRCLLPSGHGLYYCRPRLVDTKTPWGSTAKKLTYEQMNDKNQWGRVDTWGGKIMENACQAMCRDVLAEAMKRADRRGLDLRLHVHDEILGVCPEDEAEDCLKVLIECMEEPISWAEGFPLAAEGHINKHFMKD